MSKLGKFEIKEQLGSGGMGVVYRAWDSRMERWVALKTIQQDKAERSEFVKRFRREALSAGRLDHPNIVTIYEFDEQDDVCYIAMQFLEGTDLESLIAAPRWESDYSIFRKLEILIQICQGLSYAHRKGVIHRDVKPANIMILPDGTVKLVDFGIARIGDATSTTQSMLLGTAPYMAPEQIEGRPTDERVDIFAVGVIGYRMFTRHFPFEAPNLSSVLYKIVHDPPPGLSTFLSEFPAELERILFHALEKNRADRYPSMEEMAFELQSLLSSLNTSLVSSYVEESKRLLVLHDFTRAKELLRKVLELEPGNQTATALWQQVQRQLQQEQIKRRVQGLLNDGIQAYERSDWLRALDCFEQGLELDPTHEMLQTYRNLTSREQEKIQQIGDNLKSARESLQRRDWLAAREHLVKVLDVSPYNTEAAALLSEVDVELAEIEKRRNAQQYLDRAQQALGAGQYGEALSLLDKAQALDPQNAQANHLRERALAEQKESEQHKVRAEKIALVQSALEKSDFALALQQADVGLRAFPNDPALQQLQARANQGLEASRRRKQLAEQLETAQTLLDQGDLAGAKKLYTAVRSREPGDSRVQALGQAIEKAEERQEREGQRDAELERARALMRDNRHDEARRVLEDAKTRFGRSPALQELTTLLTQEMKRVKQDAEVQQVLRQAAELAEKEEYKKAAEVLKKASRKMKATAITEELARIAKLGAEAAERRAYLQRVQTLLEKQQWVDALRLLNEAPEAYRSSSQYRDLWQAATAGLRAAGGATATQDDIPTSAIPVSRPAPTAARSTGFGAAAAAAPARRPEPRTQPQVPAGAPAGFAEAIGRALHLPARFVPIVLGAVLVAVLAVVVVVVWRMPAKPGQPGAAAGPSGFVRIDISPWAEVKEVSNVKTGKAEAITGQTPIQFALPPGEYRIKLVHPKLGELVVPAQVQAGATINIRQSFPEFDVEQLLRSYE